MTQSQYFGKFIKMLINPKNREKTQEQLYNELEKWHESKENRVKYTNFNSFRKAKSIWYKVTK